MAEAMASANASQVRVVDPFFVRIYVRGSVGGAERDKEKMADEKRLSCSAVVAVFARDEMIDSWEAKLR